MTPAESVQLTGYIQAKFPSQPINEFTPEALHEDLEPYSLADCRAAVRAIAHQATGDRTQWCAPTDVLAWVKRIRAKRINDHPPLTPPPGLDPIETNRWLADRRRQIGDGHVIDSDAAYGELKPRHLPDLRAILPAPDVASLRHDTQETP